MSGLTQKWTLGQETDYRKGLAALYHDDLAAARKYFNNALSASKGDVQTTVAAAYTEYQLGKRCIQKQPGFWGRSGKTRY